MQTSFDELFDEFSENYGSDHDFEGSDLVSYVVAAGHFLAEIVGEEASTRAMAHLARELGCDCAVDEDWERSLRIKEADVFSEWAVGTLFFELNAYANYGIVIASGSGSILEQVLSAKLDRAAGVISKVPFEPWGLARGDAARTLLLAQARWALDHGEPVRPEALAEFGRVSERRVRNLMAGSESIFRTKDGMVLAEDAIQWLAGRKWRPSVWQQQKHLFDFSEQGADYHEEVLFVPVAKDGSVFCPALLNQGLFTIGDKKTEKRFGSFHEALEALQKMRRAVWPRPAALGEWSLVSAARWERKTMAELTRIEP